MDNNEFRYSGVGRMMVDVYGLTNANTVVCILPVFIQRDNIQMSLQTFMYTYNSQYPWKYRLQRILRVRPHSNYFPPPLHKMLIYNELDRIIEEFKLNVTHSSVTVWNLKYEV